MKCCVECCEEVGRALGRAEVVVGRTLQTVDGRSDRDRALLMLSFALSEAVNEPLALAETVGRAQLQVERTSLHSSVLYAFWFVNSFIVPTLS